MDLLQQDDEYFIVPDDVPRINKGPANKRKGSRVERDYANIFKKYVPQCQTTRNTSKLLDACKVDLNFLPVLHQIKAGIQRGYDAAVILNEMTAALSKHLPPHYPEHKMPKVVIHHKDTPDGRRTKPRLPTDTMVTMTFDDYMILFQSYLKTINI